MAEVGIFDAKTNLSRLIERVRDGEEIIITRRGAPVARLLAARNNNPGDVKAAIARLRQLREKAALGPGLSVQDLIDETRSWPRSS